MPVLTSGQRLGTYVIDTMIGTGGMAEVYRAHHATLDRPVAIKVLNPTFNKDPTFPLRFLREAKASARLNHPNIITIYDFDEKGEVAYLVMELAEDGTMAERVPGYTTLADAVAALAPVFAAVHYAHERGVVHRDIKPDNVLMAQAERPLLADFGLARLQDESLDVDEVGLILGTPYYMAPEQVLGEDVDARADVYALGILVYAVVVGRVPFDGETFTAIARQHLNAPPPSVRAALPDAPDRLDAAVQRATAKRREERFPSAAALFAELEAAAAEAARLPVGAAAAAVPARSATVPARPAGAGEFDRTVVDPGAGRLHAFVPGVTGAACPACGSLARPGVRFCTACGGRMPALEESPIAPVQDAGGVSVHRRRRSSSFSTAQWLAIVLAGLAVLFINAVGLWLAQAGRSAGEGGYGSGVLTYIFDNLPWFKSGMTLVALALAVLASWDMWIVVGDMRQRSPATYRRLRQYHRLMGYAAVLTAFAIGLLTCVGIFGFDLSTPRRAVHTVMGTALLIVIVAKIATVRGFPRYRRYLNWLGVTVLAFYALTFLTSAVPWVWGQITGDGPSYYQPREYR